MNELGASILSSVASSVVLAGIILFIVKHWYMVRLKEGVKFEYDKKIEKIKAELSASNLKLVEYYKSELASYSSVLGAAHKAVGESSLVLQQKRLCGVEVLWKAMLTVRNNTPVVLMFVDTMPESDFEKIFRHDFSGFDTSIDARYVVAMCGVGSVVVEEVRPFVGDYLWHLYSCYLTLHLAAVSLYTTGKGRGVLSPWYRDAGCLQIMSAIVDEKEKVTFDSLEIGHLTWVRTVIENKFLKSADRILSGKELGDFTVQESLRATETIREWYQQTLMNKLSSPR
ncbi:MAG: hypothetical protein ACP59X_20770 [Solidesulfovibrio sp. DCME]|uniref:hypothetical protein n=1 Tax=Solidesulfovibrio sp. DCME TaxID=3447380 RepID=UPI003D10B9A6